MITSLKPLFRILLVAIACQFLNLSNLKAQLLTSNYTFTQLSQTYTPVTGGTVRGSTLNNDELFSGVPIGFFIAYNGGSYNTVGISPNGYIWFGPTPPAATNYTPISSTTGSAAYICAFARNLESRSAAGGGELRTSLTGTAPGRIFTIQWKNYQRFSSGTADNGDIFNFQIRLHEYNQRIEIVYGSMITNQNATAQVGMRGSLNTNFMNRIVNAINGWNNSASGTANTSYVSYTTTRMPLSGQTYRWTPTSLLNTSLSGGDVDTVRNSNPDLVSGSTPLTASFVDEGGITSLGIQRFINGVSQPWVAMTKLSGDSISGTWQVQLPDVNVNADVVYLYRIINPSNFFQYSGTIAYEVGYLRVYAPADKLLADNTQGSGIPLKAESSVSPLKITEVVFDRLASGINTSYPSYIPNGDIDLVELSNLSSESVSLDGIQVKVTTIAGQHQLSFPSGILVPAGGRITVQVGGTSGQVSTGLTDELYFETGGLSNSLQSNTPSGISLFNAQNDVLDAVAFNGYKFPSSSGVRIVHWYGDIASSTGKAGARRTTMTDHNTSTDWEFTDAITPAGIGAINPGLAAVATAPQFTWTSSDIPGWSATGQEVQLPVLTNGIYHVNVNVIDNGYSSSDNLTVTVYAPMIPVADFSASATSIYLNQSVAFTNLTLNYPDSYSWVITPGNFTFINNTSATTAEPEILFQTPGQYSVTLTAVNTLGTSTITKTNLINVMAYLGSCVMPNLINISDVTNNSAKISWSQGYSADSMQVKYTKNSGGGNGTQFTTTSELLLNGLLQGTSYNVRVRPWCNGAASDGYTSKYYFTTAGLRIAADEEQIIPFSVTLFPNPSNCSFKVKLDGNNSKIILLGITDLAGKNIYKNIYAGDNEIIQPDINLSPGLYLIKISTDDNFKTIRLVVL